ncbi:MAG TPA: diguanylate cyclase, partial [Afifellaceae bacterium]|nr:diguanylate cyclase [Afifellaceae bacterium]
MPRNAAIIDLTDIVERHLNRTDRLQVSTAPDADGIVRRIEVRSENEGGSSDWIVFALANTSDEQIDRLLVAPHYRLVGSGLMWPDLGRTRIGAVTPSQGFAPERIPDNQADIYRITLDPGAIITFVAEMNSARLPKLQLWEADAYKATVNSFTLYRGIVIGIAGLLALILTVLFVVKGTAMFPATAMLAWAVLAYISIDFGFWDRTFATVQVDQQSLRAATEVLLAAAMLVFLYTYLHLHRWHVRYSHVTIAWLLGIAVLSGVIAIDPAVASGIARMSLAATGIAGLFIVFYLALHNYDRAIMLIPTWLVLVFWLGAGWLAVTGRLDNPVVQSALAGGLVLIVMLAAFTIMQHAFAGGALAQGLISDAERKALALVGAGHAVWDWDVSRDRITVGPEVEDHLGLKRGALAGPARNWLALVHPGDRDRFRIVLDTIVNHRRGRINQAFRMRASDGHFLWFSLQARPIVGSDGEVMRCAGTIGDVTEQKVAEERLLHDSVYDNLTGLPNRQLFLDRLETAIDRATAEDGTVMPTVMSIDLDKFRDINEEFSISIGDSVMLAVARRLSRLLRPQDSLARLQGDGFAVILLSETEKAQVEAFANDLMSSIRAAISIADKEIFLSASIGIAPPEDELSAEDQFKRAEVACYHAKRLGGGRAEFYRASLGARGNRMEMDKDLRIAIDNGDIDLQYQPIVRLADETIAGYEALMRWNHPQRGKIPPSEFIPV